VCFVAKNRSAAAAVAEVEAPVPVSGKRVLLRATLFAPRGAYTVWIRDISPAEAHVTSADRLPTGCDVVLKRGEFFAAGRISAASESGAEVAFYRQLDDMDVAQALLPHTSGGD
jgi:hypothetical protein